MIGGGAVGGGTTEVLKDVGSNVLGKVGKKLVEDGVEFASALYILKNIDVPDIPQYNKSQLEEVLDIADNYKLSDDVFYNHIIDRHGYNSSYRNKSHFNSNFDIKAGIDSTLRGNNSVIKPNTQGRSGYIFEQTFSYAIGKNSKGKDLYTIKVVIDEYGNVVTAFPIKWWGEYNEFLYWKFS